MKKPEETIALDSLKPNPRNPRKMSDAAFDLLCKSIRRDPEFMRMRPLVVDRNNVVRGGNQRLRALLSMKRKRIPASWVHRARNLTEEQLKRFELVDNSPEGMAGYWDFDILQKDFTLKGLEDLGFRFPQNVEAAAEWDGMPEFDSKEAEGYQVITVHFAAKKDIEQFAAKVGRKITRSTRFLWFPEQKIRKTKEKVYSA